MKDTIYREAAIEALREHEKWLTVAHEARGLGTVKYSERIINAEDAYSRLNTLPSAGAGIREYETSCGVPMEEAVKVMLAYSERKEQSTDRPQGEWVSRIDNGTWMLECSVCGCRVQEEKYRIAVGENATRCPYCGAELGLGGYLYDEYADRPSQRGENHEAPDGE